MPYLPVNALPVHDFFESHLKGVLGVLLVPANGGRRREDRHVGKFSGLCRSLGVVVVGLKHRDTLLISIPGLLNVPKYKFLSCLNIYFLQFQDEFSSRLQCLIPEGVNLTKLQFVVFWRRLVNNLEPWHSGYIMQQEQNTLILTCLADSNFLS